MFDVVRVAVRLGLEDVLVASVPSPRPGFVRPAEAKRKLRLSGTQDLLHRLLKQSLAVKPVMVIAEAVDAVLHGQFRLRLPRLRRAEIILAEIRGDVGLIMPGEQRLCLRHVCPFGEALAPPTIVLRDGMELRKEERDQPCDVRGAVLASLVRA